MADRYESRLAPCMGTDRNRCVLRALRLGFKVSKALSALNRKPAGAATVLRRVAVKAFNDHDLSCFIARGLACPIGPRKPCYDHEGYELRLGGVVARLFRREAPNQMEVLRRFQAEDWPPYIVDALGKRVDPKYAQRLETTVYRLNHGQTTWLIVFHCHATDRAISWELKR